MNYSELTAQISDYLQEFGTSFVANIPNFVKSAENRILHEADIPVFTKNSTSTLTINEKYVSLPSDYISMREISIVSGGNHSFLMQKDTSFIREAYPSPTTFGLPRFYAQYDHNTLLVGPTPDLAYSVEMHYFYSPPSIVTAGTSWIGDNAPSLLLYACLVEGYIFNKGDPDLIREYDRMYKEALQRVKLLGAGKTRTDNYRTPVQETAGV